MPRPKRTGMGVTDSLTEGNVMLCNLCEEALPLLYCEQVGTYYCQECHKDCSPDCIEKTNKLHNTKETTMKKGRHTLSPWIVASKTVSETLEIWAGSTPIAGRGISIDPNDARLIAAAPTMYEAIRNVLEAMEVTGLTQKLYQASEQLKEAVNCAEGNDA